MKNSTILSNVAAAEGQMARREPTMDDVPALARAFCDVLREWLTNEEMAEAIRRNEETRSKYGNAVCHSQDFCDANMAMDEALGRCGIKSISDVWEEHAGDDAASDRAGEAFIERLSPVWNEAWSRAKAADFDPRRIPG